MAVQVTQTKRKVSGDGPGRERRTRRIEVRVTPSLYEELEYAADLAGQTLSGFVVEAARRWAVEAVEQRQVIRFNMEQSRVIADLVLNPPDPPPALLELIEEHEQRIAAQRASTRPNDG